MTREDADTELDATGSSHEQTRADVETSPHVESGDEISRDRPLETCDVNSERPGVDSEATTPVVATTVQPAEGQILPDTPEIRRQKEKFRRRVDSEVVDHAVVGDKCILLMDSESCGDWMTEVPATRSAVLPGQRIWRIPDNWEHYFTVVNDHAPDEVVYRIGQLGTDVVLRDLETSDRAKAGYRVDRLGLLKIKFDGTLNKAALTDVIASVEGGYRWYTDLDECLQLLRQRWGQFRSGYISYVSKWGTKRTWSEFDSAGATTIDSWEIEPWENELDFVHIVSEVCRFGDGVVEAMAEVMMEGGVVSPYPTMALKFDTRTRLPVGYSVRALVETGCSAQEVVDYLMTEFLEETDKYRHESHPSLVAVRDATDSTVRANTRAARNRLDS